MISFLRGNLVSFGPDSVVIDVSGVGYEVKITSGAYSKINGLSGEVTLITDFIVREDSMTLYGFKDEAERDIFRILYNVSGIGPKTAVVILSRLSVENLILALSCGDIKTLTSVPGIGKKTAERLILELRDKLAPFASQIDRVKVEFDTRIDMPSDAITDATMVLVALGYTQSESEHIVKMVAKEIGSDDSSEISKAALLKISQYRR